MALSARLAAIVAWILLIVWTLAPLVATIASPLGLPAAEAWRLAVPDARRAGLLVETLLYAGAVAAAATLAGASAALYCWRRHGPLVRLAERTALLSAAIPPCLHALAWLPWLAAFAGHGAGWIPAGWVQTLAMLPFGFGLQRLALEDLDAGQIEAARVFGDDNRLLARVLLPALRPAAAAAFSLAFLLTLGDPTVPSLFSTSTYAMDVFAEFSASHSAGRAMLLAMPLVLAGALALAPLGRYWRTAVQRPTGSDTPMEPLAVRWLGLGAAFMVLPALALSATLLRHLWPLSIVAGSMTAGIRDAGTSVSAALVASIAVVPVALSVSGFVAARPRLSWWLVAVPLAVPGSLAGAGLIWLWNRDWPATPYGTFWMLPLAMLARFAPLAVLAVAAWRARLDPELMDAARVFATPRRAWWHVELRLLAPGLVAGAAIVCALSLAELSATILVVAPGSGTLAMRIYNYLHYGASASVAALALALMAGTGAAVLGAARLWRSLS